MNGHAKFPPSGSSTWLECSWSAHNVVPEEWKKQATKDAAAEGTRVHEALMNWFYDGVTPLEGDAAREPVELWSSFVDKIEYVEMSAEERVRLSDDVWGTVDLLALHPVVTTIVDYKNGKWDVDAYHNTQMLTYGAAVLDQTPAQWFRFVIFQPNGLDQESGDRGFKQWIAHRSEVEAHRARVLRAVADRSHPKPGPHCRWCPAFQVCPAMSQDAFFTMGAMTRAPEHLSTNDLVRLLRLIRALHDNKEAYEEALTIRGKLGYPLPDGAGLKPGRAHRAWNDPIQAAAHLYQNFGAKGVKPVSPAQAEKLGPAGKIYASVGAHKPEPEHKVFY